ncbi:toxin [Streptomyces sp. NPDC059688]|uniref:toxin n=1 Tax=Streptomyces sp. NPDC059688 TaxID=3346906 RepID=UPI00368C1801
MGTRREMRRLADTLIGSMKVPALPADPEALFDALVESAQEWRQRPLRVVLREFPPHTASGLWIEQEDRDIVIVDRRAPKWMQIVILCHELWHVHKGQSSPLHMLGGAAGDGSRPAAARTTLSEKHEREADRFGMLMGLELRPWLEASEHSVYCHEPTSLAGRIGAALNYRGEA